MPIGNRPASSPALSPTPAQQPSTTNTDAVWALAATPGSSWNLCSLWWAYSGAPTNGQLTVSWTDAATRNAVTETIPAGQSGSLYFFPRSFPVGSAVTITLKAAGSVTGAIFGDAFLS